MSIFINLINNETKPHKHNFYEIIVYTKGKGRFIYEKKYIDTFPGKILIVPPNIVHSSVFEDTLERIYINGDLSQIFNMTEPTVILDTAEKEGLFLANMIY